MARPHRPLARRRLITLIVCAAGMIGLVVSLAAFALPDRGSPGAGGPAGSPAADPFEMPPEYLFQIAENRSFEPLACPAEWRDHPPSVAEVERCVEAGRSYFWRLAERQGYEISEWTAIRRLNAEGRWREEFVTRISWAINETVNTIMRELPDDAFDQPGPVPWCPEDGSPPPLPPPESFNGSGYVFGPACLERPGPRTVPEDPWPGPTVDPEAGCKAARKAPAASIADTARPVVARELPMSVWDGLLTLSDPQAIGEDVDSSLLALDAAAASELQVGSAGCAVVALRPGQQTDTPLRLELWGAEPPDDRGRWQHEVDVDLPLSSGTLCFDTSEGPAGNCATVPPGRYRARLSARLLETARDGWFDGEDRWRLRLWPSAQNRPIALRKAWSGWGG
jgi:hypothetical protein